MKMSPLDNKIPVRISLSKDRIIEADIREELSIDMRNIREEVLGQPAKYAIWAVLSDLAEKKVEMATERLTVATESGLNQYPEVLDNYIATCKQYDLLFSTKEAFSHRSKVLLQLWSNPGRKREVLADYRHKVSNLKALRA